MRFVRDLFLAICMVAWFACVMWAAYLSVPDTAGYWTAYLPAIIFAPAAAFAAVGMICGSLRLWALGFFSSRGPSVLVVSSGSRKGTLLTKGFPNCRVKHCMRMSGVLLYDASGSPRFDVIVSDGTCREADDKGLSRKAVFTPVREAEDMGAALVLGSDLSYVVLMFVACVRHLFSLPPSIRAHHVR